MDWTDRIGRRLKLRDLHILLAVVQCGSMAKAASQLSVSNPVISKAMSDLEEELGVRLLDRSPKGVEPTIYAHALLDRGLVAFDELRQAVKHIEFLADPTVGEVRVAAPIGIAAGFVAVVIDRLSREHPGIVFQLLAVESGTAYAALEERKVDLVVARIFAPLSQEHMSAEVLYRQAYVVAAGARSPWVRRRRVALADLLGEPWTLPPPDSLSGLVISEAFRASGHEPPRTTVVTALGPVRNALLATGRFLTIVPDPFKGFPDQGVALKVLPIKLPSTRRPVGIITLKRRTLSPVAQLFVACARKVAGKLAKANKEVGRAGLTNRTPT
jgi:DNA-binding transcriptional LysR family regulator